MDPVSAVAVLVPLVASLDTTLRTLHHFTHDFASRKFGGSHANAEGQLRTVYLELVQVQSSLHAKLNNAQVEELLNLLQGIEHYLSDLQEAIQGVDKHRKIRLLRRFPRRRDTEAAVTSIHVAKNMIQMILLVDSVRSHNHPSSESLTAVSKTKHFGPLLNAPSTKAEEIFAWIAAPEGQEEVHQQCRAERIAGTCEWFLAREEFQSWLGRSSSASGEAIFWCRGRPGIGKTMLASKVIDQLQPSHIVAYFYIGSGKIHSASDIVTSLLRQLCVPNRIVPDRLQQIYERTHGEPGCRLELEDLLESLREASRSITQPITVIIDGLDETNIREQSDFVPVFDSLKDISFKCLITSRGTLNVLPKANNRFSEFTIGDYENRQDISTFVQSVLRENEPVDRMLDSDPTLRSELINTLISRAHGMFYWVTLQVRLILDQTHLSGIRSALKSIPSHIHEITNISLKLVKLQDEDRAELATRALALLTAAQAPLTAQALCHALGLAHVLDYKEDPSKLSPEEIPDLESIIECCMGLVKMEPSTKVVTLAHYDMLLEMRENWARYFASEHTARLATTCMAYLSLDEFSRGPCHEMTTFRRHLEDYPFLLYASQYWGHHARAALLLGTCEADVSDELHRFLGKSMNLGLSLQVAEYDPEDKQTSLELHPDQYLELSELQIASRHGLAMIVQKFLKTDPDMASKQDRCGRTALHEAAQAGWEDIVSMLIEAKADTSLVDDEGKTPFSYAAERGHAKIISILQDLQGRSGEGRETLEKALCDAAEADKTSVVEELLELGVDANAIKDQCSAITKASRGGHKRVVRMLLRKNANPSSFLDNSPHDNIPLHQAVKNGHLDVAALLLDCGANTEACDELGRTALFETLNTTDIGGAALLLKFGIDISHCDLMGNNVLHEAARTGAVEHASRFVDRGIDLASRNKEGLTPLHLAARHGHESIAALLLQKGAAVEDRDCKGMTPLMYAVAAGNKTLCVMLLNSGASVNAVVTGNGQASQSTADYESEIYIKPPAMTAMTPGHSKVAERDNDAAINERSNSSRTPLELAVEGGHTEIFGMLINCGADIHCLMPPSPALARAAKAGHIEVVEGSFHLFGTFLNDTERARVAKIYENMKAATTAAGKADVLSASEESFAEEA